VAFRRHRNRITPLSDGRYAIALGEPEREHLTHLIGQLRSLLNETDPSDPRMRRLFPTAYSTDPEADEEYQRFMRPELLESKMSALAAFEKTVSEDVVREPELLGFMQSINSMRLVLGTLLDVGEDQMDIDPDDPNVDGYILYDYLSGLLDDIVQALSE
jgi:glutamine synthetase adenylyltransferase